MRTIELDYLDEEAYTAARERNYDEFQRAIAYLSTWSLTNYNFTALWVDRQGDITATYWKDKPRSFSDGSRPGYVIGAVWNGERYGFHS